MPSKQLSDILITFKGGSRVPIGDIIAQSSDPFLRAQLTPRTPPSPDHPPFPLTFRTSTDRATRDPEWNETWHLGGIPSEGFDLEIKVLDEDKPGDFDDKLGVARLPMPRLPSPSSDGKPGEPEEFTLKIEKRKASKRAYAATYVISWCNKDFKKQRGRIMISVQNLGKSTCTRNCPCVLGPMRWSIHSSPMIGRIAGTEALPDDTEHSKIKEFAHKVNHNVKPQKEKPGHYSFQANKLQLLGTIPKELRNTYVEYRPFIGWVFSGRGVRGYILQRALHAQHRRIYSYNAKTKCGLVATPPAISKIEAGDAQENENNNLDDTDEFAASKMFLEMVHYDEKPNTKVPGGRLYTYVITLQGEWRFTETGPEFSMDFLSKHSMHSDVAKQVAFAGEFFVRRRRGKGGMHTSNHENVANGHHGKDDDIQEQNKDSFEAPGFENGAADSKKEGEKEKEKEHKKEEVKESQKEEAKEEDKEEANEEGGNEKSESKTQNGDSENPESVRSSSNPRNSFSVSNKASHNKGRSREPGDFVLIIDNDSGTYRPDSKTLPLLQKYLERNLPGLKVKAMACDDERLKKWKEEQKPKKEVVKAHKYAQKGGSSSSSSDDEAVELSS